MLHFFLRRPDVPGERKRIENEGAARFSVHVTCVSFVFSFPTSKTTCSYATSLLLVAKAVVQASGIWRIVLPSKKASASAPQPAPD